MRKTTLQGKVLWFFIGCVLAGVSSVSAEAESGLLGLSLPAAFRPFAADSPWNQPIPPEPELDADSAAMIARLQEAVGKLKGDLTQWTVPLFVIDAGQAPLRRVIAAEPLHPSVDPDSDGWVENLPLPDGIWPDPQKDGHLLLVDPQQRRSWDLSRALPLPDGSWRVTRLAVWDLDGPGYAPADFGKRWWMFGARGTGMPLLAGLIRPEEVAAGEIRHALACATPINRRAAFPGGPLELCSPPAARSDGKLDGPQFLPAGARLQLDPTLDLERLGLSPASRVVARAMQVYGLINADVADSFKIYFQNLGADGGRWNELGDFRDLAKIPLDRFRVLSCQTVGKMP